MHECGNASKYDQVFKLASRINDRVVKVILECGERVEPKNMFSSEQSIDMPLPSIVGLLRKHCLGNDLQLSGGKGGIDIGCLTPSGQSRDLRTGSGNGWLRLLHCSA
jgi:hypothetical protein